MAVQKISTQTVKFDISGHGSRWLLHTNASVETSTGHGIYNFLAENIQLRIAGKVAAMGSGTVNGIRNEGDGADIIVAGSGEVKGYVGLYLQGDQADLLNNGKILGMGTGSGIAGFGDGFRIENAGLITGASGVNMSAYGTLINQKSGVIEAEHAVSFNTNVDCDLINHGKLLGEKWAFLAGSGDDLLVNRGTMSGDVNMGAGADHIDLRGGTATGKFWGGEGNDVFIVDRKGVQILEGAGEGYDLVWTTASFTLAKGAEFEVLGAKGKGDIKLAGNEFDNTVAGNAGDNILSGKGGNDTFYSGAGTDLMIGGKGMDTFVFRKGDGHDTIGDFTLDGAEQDVIDLHFLKGFKTFSDVLDVAKDTSDGVVLALGKGDSLTLEGVRKADLDAMHFDFV